MNKKKIIACALLVVAALIVAAVVAKPASKEPEQMNKPEAVTEVVTSTESPNAVVSGEPLPYSDENSVISTEDNSENMENVQPEGDATLPPEVDVSMGVVEGDKTPDIDEDEETPAKPTESTKETEPPKETEPSVSTDSGDPLDPFSEKFDITLLTYEIYMSMTGEQQMATIDAFSTPDSFARWFKAAEAKYKQEHPDVEIGGDGTVDMGKNG